MTLSDVEGYAPIPSILKCRLSYTCGVVDKISTDSALHGPSVITELLGMATLCNRGAIIFLPCSFFLLFLSSSSSVFSSPNLSGCRLDVCYTSTHGGSLVQI